MSKVNVSYNNNSPIHCRTALPGLVRSMIHDCNFIGSEHQNSKTFLICNFQVYQRDCRQFAVLSHSLAYWHDFFLSVTQCIPTTWGRAGAEWEQELHSWRTGMENTWAPWGKVSDPVQVCTRSELSVAWTQLRDEYCAEDLLMKAEEIMKITGRAGGHWHHLIYTQPSTTFYSPTCVGCYDTQAIFPTLWCRSSVSRVSVCVETANRGQKSSVRRSDRASGASLPANRPPAAGFRRCIKNAKQDKKLVRGSKASTNKFPVVKTSHR